MFSIYVCIVNALLVCIICIPLFIVYVKVCSVCSISISECLVPVSVLKIQQYLFWGTDWITVTFQVQGRKIQYVTDLFFVRSESRNF